VAHVLAEYLEGSAARADVDVSQFKTMDETELPPASQLKMKIGDLCPQCGEAAVVNEEGCRKCYACGYSEC
jgi:ribonucleoside-diphosphate reductase alpha chain